MDIDTAALLVLLPLVAVVYGLIMVYLWVDGTTIEYDVKPTIWHKMPKW